MFGWWRGQACQTLQILRSPNASGPFVDRTVAWPLDSLVAWPGCISNPTLLFPAKTNHGKNKIAGRTIALLVLGF